MVAEDQIKENVSFRMGIRAEWPSVHLTMSYMKSFVQLQDCGQ